MNTTQMNVRMDRLAKESGDEALALIGFSPTQAVRALWEKAARRGEDLEEVAKLLCGAGESRASTGRAPDDTLFTSWSLVENTLAAYGLDYAPSPDTPADDELLEEVLYERLDERGLA